MRARSLMVMGTASDVGKSVIATGLCRAFARRGVSVAPFKSQNMSNNAAVCAGGGEIGRAQAVQAMACGLEPSVEMNPVLLKPESGFGCQVVIGGRARFRINAWQEHDRYRAHAWPEIVRSYNSLAERFDLIIVEGAGGAAEINLRDRDLANWIVADLADAAVLIVGDIDKGGVFASLAGTVELLSASERRRVKGLLINKFRGDRGLLEPGPALLRQRTGIPVIGVLPYERNLGIPQEDSASLETRASVSSAAAVRIGVVRFPEISNYTDFEPLESEPDVAVHYLSDPASAPDVDVLILPGSKTTVADLKWLRDAGWENYLVRCLRRGGFVLGICGGYQMLGRRIVDRDRVESDEVETVSLGLLDIETIFAPGKITDRVTAVHLPTGLSIEGYEIHSGRIAGVTDASALFRVGSRGQSDMRDFDGAQSADGRVIGTSIHGLFDLPDFRRWFIDRVRKSLGLEPLAASERVSSTADHIAAFDRLADLLETHLDMRRIAALAGLDWNA